MNTQNKVEVIPLFSSPVLVSNENENCSFTHIIDYCNSLEYRQNKSGNLTSVDSYILENPMFSEIKRLILGAIEQYTKRVMMWSNNDFFITQSWININPKNTAHHTHFHKNSIISGTFYLQTNDNDSITFLSDRKDCMDLVVSSFNLWNSTSWDMCVKTNTITIFPSLLSHEVKENTSADERISISFNVFVKGMLGTNKNLTLLQFK